jgi:putative phage-type endonuclease
MNELIQMSDSFPEQKTDEWLDMRKQKITSTDVGLLLNGNRKDLQGLMEKKLGKPRTFFGNEATRWGEANEDKAMEAFSKLYDIKPIFMNVLQHKTHPQFIFSPDGVTPSGNIIEIKAPFSRKISTSVSFNYRCQVQMGIEILRSHGFTNSKAFFVEWKPKGHSYEPENEILSVKIIERDPSFFSQLLEKSEEILHEINSVKQETKGKEINFDGFLKMPSCINK